jgi:hypothetical protein
MSTLRALNNVVMFKFLDETGGSKGRFHEQTRPSGIIIVPTVSTQKVHRWGQVVVAGPKTDLVPGDYILIESLMWMEGNEWEGGKIWKTDDTKILAVTDNLADCQSQAL